MALLGTKLNKKVIMVVEKLEELRQIITLSRQLGLEPLIGIRTRLLSRGAGKWAESAGENAKFGLTTAELLTATEMLKAENLTHCFKLLHFHIGSQVPDILIVKKAIQEASRFYAKLYKMGFQIEYLDVGGGLGVDYDGSRSAFSSSTNYTLQEYANDIIYYVADVCDTEKVPHPDIISERAGDCRPSGVLIIESGDRKVRQPSARYTARTSPPSEGAARHPQEPAEVEQAGGYHDALGAGRRNICSRWHDDGRKKQDRGSLLGNRPGGRRELQRPGLRAGRDSQARGHSR
jgi:arginine decarboxylase